MSVSLSTDELRKSLGDPSCTLVIDCGDEAMGGSLVVEDIGKTGKETESERINVTKEYQRKGTARTGGGYQQNPFV
jgi:hypothetical protein